MKVTKIDTSAGLQSTKDLSHALHVLKFAL